MASALAAMLLAMPVLAQTVEHDPPKTFAQNRAVIAPPNLDAVLADETPIEGPLTGLVFLGENDTVLALGAIAPGIDTSRVPLIDDPAFLLQLRPYLGQPVSLKLIAEIEAEVANWARAEGMPFVSISTPEQEITGGVLQFRIQEFVVGMREAIAPGRMTPGQVLEVIRTGEGDKINSDMLAEDLNWLSRSPFRDATADFIPGAEPGETDMTIRVVESKPFIVTAGYDNTGARATGTHRLRSSITVGDIPVPGSVLTYQFAASPDVFKTGIAGLGGHPSYQSQSGNLFLPTMPRQAFEASFNAIESNSYSAPFDVRSNTTEAMVGYRMLGSELGLPPGWGEVFGGFEYRRGVTESRFAGVLATRNAAEIAQFFAGWKNLFVDENGSTDVSGEIRLSPGGLTPDNTGAAFSVYSATRVTTATYAYVDIGIDRSTTLPYDLTLRNDVSVHIASGPLLGTEQMPLGGDSAVRGYLPDDGAYDHGIVMRNTLSHAPYELGGAFTPFLLADFGLGLNAATGASQTFASVGAGADFNIEGSLTGTVAAAVALTNAAVTRRGDVNVTLRIGGQY